MVVECIYTGRNIVPQDQDKMRQYKMALVDGERLIMTLDRWEDYRTKAQQGLLHELLGRYARAEGESIESVKIRLKVDLGHYLPGDKLLQGEIDAPSWRGRFIDLHTVYPHYYAERTFVFLRSEADYTKRMENEFIDYVISVCGESGVDIEDIVKQLQEARK